VGKVLDVDNAAGGTDYVSLGIIGEECGCEAVMAVLFRWMIMVGRWHLVFVE